MLIRKIQFVIFIFIKTHYFSCNYKEINYFTGSQGLHKFFVGQFLINSWHTHKEMCSFSYSPLHPTPPALLTPSTRLPLSLSHTLYLPPPTLSLPPTLSTSPSHSLYPTFRHSLPLSSSCLFPLFPLSFPLPALSLSLFQTVDKNDTLWVPENNGYGIVFAFFGSHLSDETHRFDCSFVSGL